MPLTSSDAARSSGSEVSQSSPDLTSLRAKPPPAGYGVGEVFLLYPALSLDALCHTTLLEAVEYDRLREQQRSRPFASQWQMK